MKSFTIGGVPEHFNLPWHLAIENEVFINNGIDLTWQDFPEGTGAMCTALREGSIDISIILTEGIIKDIIAGNPSKIVKVFVKSPLLWGIHVNAESKFKTVKDLENTKAAISRYGSGSHLMAIVNAQKNGFIVNDIQYEVVDNLHGAIDALSNGSADYFMWEHFTTKPIVDTGIFRRIGDIETPWPCFVIAVRNEVLENDIESIKTIIKLINEQLIYFKEPKNKFEIIKMVTDRYSLDFEDVEKWISITKWSQKKTVSRKLINNIQNKLKSFGVIDHEIQADQLIKNVF